MITRAAAFAAAAPLALTAALAQVTITPPKRLVTAPERRGPGLISKTRATADAQTFAHALAEAGHPSGFIMPMSERQRLLPPDSGEMLTLGEAVAAFTARGRYRASTQNGVIVVRHVRTPEDIAGVLDAPRRMAPIRQPFSAALFDSVLRSLARRRVRGVPGREPGPGPDCPVDSTVEIPGRLASITGTLNAMVARTKGVAWLVRFGGDNDTSRLQVGYVCGNGVWSALSVPGW